MKKRALILLMLLILLLLSGCINEGGNVSTAPPTTTAAPTTTSPPTTTAAPTTTQPPPVEIKEPVQIGNVEWMYYDDAVAALREDGKHILLYFWRDECPYCTEMDEITFSDGAVVDYIAENFHPVEVDIWSSEQMSEMNPNIDGQYLGNLYKLYGAAPACGFINPEERIVLPMMGRMYPDQFLIFLEFISSELYKEMTYNEYLESLESQS